MDYNEIKDLIEETVDEQARSLVGMCCKRVEVLQRQNSLTPDLYKALSKELIYENSRVLKKMLNIKLGIGKVEFKSKEKNNG